MTEENRHQIYIYDHPESKIQFLETTLAGHDWHATILYPDQDEASRANAQTTMETLQKRGYYVKAGPDEHGRFCLRIHHIGQDTHLPDVFREYGLVKGAGHVITHPSLTLGHMVNSGAWAFDQLFTSVKDPARLNGFINIAAEAFLIPAGWGNKHGKFWDPKNLLQTVSGLLFFSQSFIYMFLAKSDNETISDHLTNKIKHVQAVGGDVTKLSFNDGDAPRPGFAHTFLNFLRRYPIEVGAAMNDLGMLAYLGHAMGERKSWQAILKKDPKHPEAALANDYINKGFWRDIGGACTSLIGWTLMVIPRRHPSEHVGEDHDSSVFAKAWNEVRENPQHLAGVFTLASSSQRLLGSRSKKNMIQTIGETIYIGGDVALMFTKNDEYGGSNSKNIEQLGSKIGEEVTALPMLLGPKSQEEFAHNIAEFIHTRAKTEQDMNKYASELSEADLSKNAIELEQVLLRKIRHANNEKLEKIFDQVAGLAHKFPASQRNEIGEKIAAAMSEMPWIHASPDELKEQYKTAFKSPETRSSKLVQMKDIAQEVADLVFAIPGIDATYSSSVIYDVLAPYLRGQASDASQLKQAMETTAAKVLIPPEPEKAHPRVNAETAEALTR